jgi:predicted neutral ceramidase superfamily lipid hydrolase
MAFVFSGMLATSLIMIFLSLSLIIFSIIFWIAMLVDCIKRKFKEDAEKIVWLLVMFTGVVGSLIYYFIVKRRDTRKK